MTLETQVALVTGGSQGIGQAIALRLAQEKAHIAINYHSNPQGAEETKTQIEAIEGKCHLLKGSEDEGFIVKADLANINAARALVNQTLEHFGKLDILINNAGIEKRAPFWEVTEADYDEVVNVNLKGVFFTIQAFVQHLRETKRSGTIVNISSVHEELPFPNFASYCVSKGGLKMLTRNLSVELAPLGIRINNIAPGAIETPINTNLLNNPQQLGALLNNIPLNRLGKPQDVASLVAFLVSEEASYITGTTFFVDGGLLWNYKEQ